MSLSFLSKENPLIANIKRGHGPVVLAPFILLVHHRVHVTPITTHRPTSFSISNTGSRLGYPWPLGPSPLYHYCLLPLGSLVEKRPIRTMGVFKEWAFRIRQRLPCGRHHDLQQSWSSFFGHRNAIPSHSIVGICHSYGFWSWSAIFFQTAAERFYITWLVDSNYLPTIPMPFWLS